MTKQIKNREIKFRAWDIMNRIMIPSFEIWQINQDDSLRTYIDGYGKVSPNSLNLMQYTGLKDKKRTKEYPEGQEIYEGDILKYVGSKCTECGTHNMYPNHSLYIITWDNKHTGFDCETQKKDNYMDSSIWHTDMEVIGNIYENGDLLNG